MIKVLKLYGIDFNAKILETGIFTCYS